MVSPGGVCCDNVYWWAASGLAVWFLLIHTPPLLMQRQIWKFQDPLLILHLMGAGGVYLACIHNALLTPSTFEGRSKSWHVNVGRLGLLLGTVGALSGAVLTWTVDTIGSGRVGLCHWH